MEKKNLRIEQFEDKIARNGKHYTRFKTVDGWLSVFEDEVANKLKLCVGKDVSVKVNYTGTYKTIVDFYGDNGLINPNGLIGPIGIPIEKVDAGVPYPKTSNYVPMYVSYAKDVFISLMEKAQTDISESKIMNEAVKLVKQAKKEFE